MGNQLGALARWLGPFEFHFDTPNLNDGFEFYTPTPGDFLLDAILAAAWPTATTPIPKVFDDTGSGSPLGDFGYVADGQGLLFSAFSVPVDMSSGPNGFGNGDGSAAIAPNFRPNPEGTVSDLEAAAAIGGSAGGTNFTLPIQFRTDDPLSVWVSEDGLPGGTDPGSTQGDGAIYLCVLTPSAS